MNGLATMKLAKKRKNPAAENYDQIPTQKKNSFNYFASSNSNIYKLIRAQFELLVYQKKSNLSINGLLNETNHSPRGIPLVYLIKQKGIGRKNKNQ